MIEARNGNKPSLYVLRSDNGIQGPFADGLAVFKDPSPNVKGVEVILPLEHPDFFFVEPSSIVTFEIEQPIFPFIKPATHSETVSVEMREIPNRSVPTFDMREHQFSDALRIWWHCFTNGKLGISEVATADYELDDEFDTDADKKRKQNANAALRRAAAASKIEFWGEMSRFRLHHIPIQISGKFDMKARKFSFAFPDVHRMVLNGNDRVPASTSFYPQRKRKLSRSCLYRCVGKRMNFTLGCNDSTSQLRTQRKLAKANTQLI